MSTDRNEHPSAAGGGPALAVADLGPRPSADPAMAVHELRVFDGNGEEWRGLVTFPDVHDGRETAGDMAQALRETLQARDGTSVRALEAMRQPVRLLDGAEHDGDGRGPSRREAATELPEPADGSEPDRSFPGPVEEVLDTYHLPRRSPVVVRIAVWCVAIGVPVLLLWWLALPHTVAITVVLGIVELAIVFGGLFAIFTSAELTRLPRRRPVQAPSTRGTDDPTG